MIHDLYQNANIIAITYIITTISIITTPTSHAPLSLPPLPRPVNPLLAPLPLPRPEKAHLSHRPGRAVPGPSPPSGHLLDRQNSPCQCQCGLHRRQYADPESAAVV